MNERLFISQCKGHTVMGTVERNTQSLAELRVASFSRPRVDAFLEDALHHPVALVVAGAGCGKTQALYSFVQKHDIKTAWIQLSEADNRLSRFWESFCHALSQLNSAFAASVIDRGFPDTGEKRRRFADLLANEIKPRYHYALVFDDLHLIQNEAVLHFIELLAENTLPNCSVVILSRTDVLRNRKQLLVDERIALIGETELRFSEYEMSEYLELLHLHIAPESLAAIYEQTEGWPFAVALAAKLLQAHPGDTALVNSALRRTLQEMFDEHVLAVISAETQSFLLKLSLIDNLPIELVEQIEQGKGHMEELLRATSLIRYDSFMCRYHIHHLLFDYLRTKQGLLSTAACRDAYAKAAHWCAANDYKMDAFNYYEKIGDYDAFLSLVFTLPLAIPADMAAYLLDIFNRMPLENYESNPVLRVIHTRLLLSLGKIAEARDVLSSSISKLKEQALTPENCRTLLGLYNNLGFAGMISCARSGDYGFAQYFKEAERYREPSGFAPKGPVTVFSLGPYACMIGKSDAGEPERFIEAVAQSAQYAMSTMGGCMRGLDDLVSAEVAYFRLDSSKSERYALQALHKAREKGQFEIESKTLFLLSRIYLLLGKYEKLLDILQQMEQQIKNPAFINRHSFYEIETSWLYSLLGNQSKIAPWLQNDDWSIEGALVSDGFSDIARCKFYLFEKNYNALLAFLESRTGELGISQFLFGRIGLAAHRAVCHYHLGNRAEAFVWLQNAYELANPNALIMPFVELGNSMRSLTGSALKRSGTEIPTPWLEMIRSKAATYAKRVSYVRMQFLEAEQPLKSVRLSDRELLLLADLSHGMSRTEIARANDISVNTVKAILQLAFDKLGAENSMEAIRVAVTQKLL
jgi:LuxR family maltose regulon positive regulatory protein